MHIFSVGRVSRPGAESVDVWVAADGCRREKLLGYVGVNRAKVSAADQFRKFRLQEVELLPLFCSWRLLWVCPSLRWAWTTVHTQTAAGWEVAAPRCRLATPLWPSALETLHWCRWRPQLPPSVAVVAAKGSTSCAPLTSPILALTEVPAWMDP